jgi:hypothetical protein
MRSTAASLGVEMPGRARQVTLDDLDRIDLTIAMDQDNFHTLLSRARHSPQVGKMHMMGKFDALAVHGAGVPGAKTLRRHHPLTIHVRSEGFEHPPGLDRFSRGWRYRRSQALCRISAI